MLADTTNTAPASASAPGQSLKRRREIVSSSPEPEAQGDKRTRHLLPERIPFPEPTTLLIRLHFKLARFPGVTRVASVPVNWTVAHLHAFVQYLFGWSGRHIYRAEVYSHVVPYAKSNTAKRGEIKSCGRSLAMDDYMRGSDDAEWTCVRTPKFARLYPEDDDEEPMRGREWYRKGTDVRIDEIWNRDIDLNAGEGTCDNTEVGIKYAYDGWEVHILPDGEKHWLSYASPRNVPKIMSAKGAGPIEDDDKPDWEREDNKNKPVDEAILKTESFEKWYVGDMISYAGRKRHRVWTREEEAERQKYLVAKYEARRKEVEEQREAEGEVDEDEDDWLDDHEEVVFYEDYSDYSADGY
ncbi:hypothetical protein EXIGLDRAFT_840225 [Exidia glandulosa HHB12029]|uniref:Uncharacterized protein n=1 Tax=Exidia glandulosa HHB12029 TaxID=1314781 RepID=A0A165EJZ1_EXIGL|nr:hypothetical protein EXIGLDRAFT_840225 [Exidia glandulosa HHB12029]